MYTFVHFKHTFSLVGLQYQEAIQGVCVCACVCVCVCAHAFEV